MRKYVIAAVAAALLVGTVVLIDVSDGPDEPEEVVRAFFDAIIDKDVDEALSHVGRIGGGVPFGDEAAFLHPDAIGGGWEVRAIDMRDVSPRSAEAKVTIGDAAWFLELSEEDGVWSIIDPFVRVEMTAPALGYLKVNDRVLESPATNRFRLFPGRYEFFTDVAGATADERPAKLLVPPVDGVFTDVSAGPPVLTLTPEAQTSVQEAVNGIVDDCAVVRLPQPKACPIGTGDRITDYETVSWGAIRDAEWTVVEHPVVHGEIGGEGLAIVVDEPGVIRLSAKGRNLDEEEVSFTADCGIDAAALGGVLTADGTVDVSPLSTAYPATCSPGSVREVTP